MFFLPSKGFGTDLPDRIHVEKGSLKFIQNVSLSIAEDNYAPFIEAMQSLVPTVDIMKFSIPDFYALVTYARIHLYPNSPIKYNHICRATVFDTKLGTKNASQVKALLAENELDPKERLRPVVCETPHNYELRSYEKDLEIVYFNPEGFDTEKFDLPRVRDLAEYKRLVQNPALRYVLPALAWMESDLSLEDRLDILEKDEDVMNTIDELSKINVSKAFGVKDRLPMTCPNCGHVAELPYHIDNQSFIRM